MTGVGLQLRLMWRKQAQASMREKEVERLKAQGISASKVKGAKAHEAYYPS